MMTLLLARAKAIICLVSFSGTPSAMTATTRSVAVCRASIVESKALHRRTQATSQGCTQEMSEVCLLPTALGRLGACTGRPARIYQPLRLSELSALNPCCSPGPLGCMYMTAAQHPTAPEAAKIATCEPLLLYCQNLAMLAINSMMCSSAAPAEGGVVDKHICPGVLLGSFRCAANTQQQSTGEPTCVSKVRPLQTTCCGVISP